MRNLFFYLIFILALLPQVSCQKKIENDESELIYSYLYLDWIFAHSISDIKWQGVINRPVGIDVFLFQLKFLARGGVKEIQHCAYYRVPFKKITGKIIIAENKSLTTCPQNPQEENLYELDHINNLEVSYDRFDLKITFDLMGKKVQWLFPFYNLKTGSIHTRLKAEKEKKKISGLMLLRTDEKSFLTDSLYLGSREDRVSNHKAIVCFNINKNCEIVGENVCHLCRYGSFEVVDFRCPQGGRQFCGINHCGEKNEPACSRGLKTNESDQDGICNGELVPTFNSDHILICQ